MERSNLMTIELAISGLSLSLFCVLVTIFFIGISIVAGTAMIYAFVKALSFLLIKMKGGI
jgi:hypothetical protein